MKDRENERKRFSEDPREQMLQYLDETRFIKDRERYELEDHDIETAPNLPEMIISDLDSAYHILKAFPDTFIPYFDEAFCQLSGEMITAKILSVLPKQSSIGFSYISYKRTNYQKQLGHFKKKFRC